MVSQIILKYNVNMHILYDYIYHILFTVTLQEKSLS